jgi:N-acetylglutamate synthase-like GNAT family acetyltransferase
MSTEPVHIRQALPADEKRIRLKISEFELDDAGFEIPQFLVAEKDERIVGIGRIREHAECSEAATLGVDNDKRLKGVGAKLFGAMVEKAKQQHALYLVCVIPEFFFPFGFEIVEDYPYPMKDKLMRCETQLAVPEKYVVMKKLR